MVFPLLLSPFPAGPTTTTKLLGYSERETISGFVWVEMINCGCPDLEGGNVFELEKYRIFWGENLETGNNPLSFSSTFKI